jgi:hypothetical protein
MAGSEPLEAETLRDALSLQLVRTDERTVV